MSARPVSGIGGDRLLNVCEWAEWWGVHRNTARKRLEDLRRRYGARVVHRVGRKRKLMATMNAVESLRIVKNDPPITQEQFAKAMGEIWRKLRDLDDRVA